MLENEKLVETLKKTAKTLDFTHRLPSLFCQRQESQWKELHAQRIGKEPTFDNVKRLLALEDEEEEGELK